VTNSTQVDELSEEIMSITENSGQLMSSVDIQKSATIIEELTKPGLNLSGATFTNLITTTDNIHTKSEKMELRNDKTSDLLRESAVNLINRIAQENESFIALDMESVGQF
jgi:hypothetical protein